MSNPGPKLAVDEGADAVTECGVKWRSLIFTMLGEISFFLYSIIIPIILYCFALSTQ